MSPSKNIDFLMAFGVCSIGLTHEEAYLASVSKNKRNGFSESGSHMATKVSRRCYGLLRRAFPMSTVMYIALLFKFYLVAAA